MKAMASGVTFSAAMHRSPSFSLLLSSMRTTIRPFLISSMARRTFSSLSVIS
jgi:hypothetical protein